MKHQPFTKSTLILLVTGLLLTTGVPLTSRYFPMPDAVKGALSGMGLAVEMVALFRASRNRGDMDCRKTNVAPEKI